jgi:hypothetical protein
MEAGTTTSDHLPIEFTIRASHSLPEVGRPARGWRWTDSKKDELAALLRRELEYLSSPSVADLQQRTEELCDRVLPKRGSLRSTTRAVFWWTGEVASSRRDYLRGRRQLARARRSATLRQREDIIRELE